VKVRAEAETEVEEEVEVEVKAEVEKTTRLPTQSTTQFGSPLPELRGVECEVLRPTGSRLRREVPVARY
jgi:hypothetical protein